MNLRQKHRAARVAAAAAILRRAAALTDPARRADAVCDSLARLGETRSAVPRVVERLEDDGSGEAGVPEADLLLSCARGLEEIEATAVGIEREAGTDPGRFRSPALRADGPTTTRHRRSRGRRRLRRE